MSRDTPGEAARPRARQSERDTPSTTSGGLPAQARAEIAHPHRAPSTAVEALGIACGHQVPAVQVYVFADLDGRLRARGWAFHRFHSGPEVLTWCYPPSDLGEAHLDRGLEPITTIVATLDRSLPTDHVADCAIEVLLAGAPHGHGLRTGLAGLHDHLDSIESSHQHITLPFARARVSS
ncbi:hypothetical protein [Nocardia sp. NPDC049149]|uniref:hypothetical protein n=1 Tax=Nocardia sp. NPDC049149 TaxID=3364315 RepID=UPI0037126BD9